MNNKLPRQWIQQAADAPAPPEVPYPDEHFDWGAIHCDPIIDPTAWVAPGAVVYGRVQLKDNNPILLDNRMRAGLESNRPVRPISAIAGLTRGK